MIPPVWGNTQAEAESLTLLAWIVIGAVAGWVAQTLLKTKTGLVMMIVFGIVGAVVGGAVGSFLGGKGFDFNNLITGLNVTSVVVAIIGAVAVGALGGWWARRSAT